ncbi:peroxiredoxin [Nitrosovibrio sp. Nv17]|uniref:peroxiredoxin n=1 Tax=Nitrosovibrio sp. Nv17 TaxID=1855339 RepID=UPI00090913D1|nr:peroxiredoxin [Nitrosovibrio sp. Nv17]SFW26953.1 peroxiredoxin (alkyl hydroperoxide reductase subunit C) [Nitrosovibrio sp. Nv17]
MTVLVTRPAPDFTKPAVLPNGSFNDAYNLRSEIAGKYAVLFFYPLDFTFVCPSEIIAHSNRAEEFRKRNVEVIGISVDSQFTHYAWRNTSVDKGGIGPVGITLVADVGGEIMHAYGVAHPDRVALRATFLIDKDGIVRHQVVNDLPLGRDVDETLRIVDALQFHESHGDVCPAGWKAGDAGMKASPEGVAEYLSSHAEAL